MSSSCVPPKSCVVHDPDPSGQDDHNDTTSECGSLCTCTSSSSLASLTTIVENRDQERLTSRDGGRDPERLTSRDGGSSASLTGPRTAPPAGTQASTQTSDPNNNPYIVMLFPSQIRDSSRCGTCHRSLPLQSAFKFSLTTACEFFPWLAGFVIIYYCFTWWGIGSSFSAFLLMMGAHAVIRFVKTRGALRSTSYLPQQHRQPPISDSDEDEEEGPGLEYQLNVEASLEKPPSYEAAVVKPPPYDLQQHLTPEPPRSQMSRPPTHITPTAHSFLTVPSPGRPISATSDDDDDDEEDVFLPSYQDALKLSANNNNNNNIRMINESS